MCLICFCSSIHPLLNFLVFSCISIVYHFNYLLSFFCIFSGYLGLSDVFSWLDSGYSFLTKTKNHKYCCVLLRARQGAPMTLVHPIWLMSTLVTWVSLSLSGVSTLKLLFFTFAVSCFVREKLWDCVNIQFLSKLPPLVLASIDASCLNRHHDGFLVIS